MALYLAKSFTERSETSEFHDTMIFFTFSSDVHRCLYSCDDRIAQKAEEQVPLIANCFEPPLFSASHKNTKNSGFERSLYGSYTRMLRTALNINWQSHVTNESLYDMLPRVSGKVAWRRLGLAGHCYRQGNLAGKLVLWEPRHGHRNRGRPPSTFIP